MKTQATDLSVEDFAILTDDFRRSLRAANKSPKTVKTSIEAVNGWMLTIHSFVQQEPKTNAVAPEVRRRPLRKEGDGFLQTRLAQLTEVRRLLGDLVETCSEIAPSGYEVCFITLHVHLRATTHI